MQTFFVALRALIFATGFFLFWGWIALSVRTFDRNLSVSLPAWTESLGVVLMMAGGSLALACVGIFVIQGRGTPAVFDAPRRFVAVGPYSYVRNPMYIGGLTLLVGLGFYQRSGSILCLSLAWFLLVHLFVVYFEEPTLKKFGREYEDYRRAVPRWIPKPWRREAR